MYACLFLCEVSTMYYLAYDVYKDICNSDQMNKSFNVEDLLSDTNLKWFDTTESCPPYYIEGDSNRYYPIDVVTSIRSLYTNLILCVDDNCYASRQCIQKYPHRGSDLLMYETSRNVFSFLDKSRLDMDVVNDIMLHSAFQLLGLSKIADCPTLYTHVVLQDEYVDKLKPYLLDNCKFVPIQDVLEMRKNPTILVENLIILKGEKDNA